MKMRFLLAFVVLSFWAHAQTGQIWKKTVYREIELVPDEHANKVVAGDLARFVAKELAKGTINVYSSYEYGLTGLLNKENIKERTEPKIDTVIIIDPVSGAENRKIIKNDLDYESVHRYRIVESWSFNCATGKTDIQLLAVAPIKESFWKHNGFQGSSPWFWLSYTDMHKIFAAYEQTHKESKFADLLLRDYVQPGATPDHNGKTYSANVLRLIDLHETIDTVQHHLTDIAQDTSLTDHFCNEFAFNARGYDSALAVSFKPDTPALEKDIFMENAAVDTTIILDPITGKETVKIIRLSGFIRAKNKPLRIHERWQFDAGSGKLSISIAGISMTTSYEQTKNERVLSYIFCAPYNLALVPIERHAAAHPKNNFFLCLWDNYFLSDDKPMILRKN